MKRRLIGTVSAAFAFLWCGAVVWAQQAASRPQPNELERVIQGLQSGDEKQRDEASDALKKLTKRGLSEEEGLRALKAAAGKFPATALTFEDGGAQLIRAAASDPAAKGMVVIEKEFGNYSPAGQSAALEYLVTLKSAESLKLFSELFRKNAGRLEWEPLMNKAILKALPNDALESLLIESLGEPKTAEMAVSALLEAAEKDHLAKGLLGDHIQAIGDAYRKWLEKLEQVRKDSPGVSARAVRWQENYREALGVAEYFPDLLGHAGKGAEGLLRETLAMKDPRLSFFAIRSLIGLGMDVPQEAIDAVAADDEMRNMLYDALKKAGKKALFPKKFLNQEAFARSDMVRWLVYPTELDTVPDEIELMKVVEVDTHGEDGVVSIYLFRFRMLGKHWAAKDGWMAGIAGGYRKRDIPTTEGLGQTFSEFEKYDAMTPEKHVQKVTKLIEDAWKREAERVKE